MLIARDGTERPIDDSASPIRDPDGNVVGVVMVFRDVTEQRNVEQALREASQRKDEFLAMLAHELRNPLAPIRNALQVLNLMGSKEPAGAAGSSDRSSARSIIWCGWSMTCSTSVESRGA